jgi:hypothetical protein
VVTALDAFFGTDTVSLTLDSRAPGLSEGARTRTYARLHDAVKDVDTARVLVGFHFRNSDQEGTSLGRAVGRYIIDHFFQPIS